MELREFAERVLFATTLEEKLRRPGLLTDDHPGRAIAAPGSPERPAALRFKPAHSGKAEFPGAHQLEREEERGRLLHFFANHELLATELMALVLLRFPDAPSAFRQGVAETLQDEQMHTRLYMERMRECGIAFGALPVSGYFWRAISGMNSPLDFVAGLSLTFEQANLDYCRHFSRGFEAVGDAKTARLLERILQDEIGHVARGLRWFRRWKNPGQSDWEAYCGQLTFPLSPQRAKGSVLNIEGRRGAGLDPAFIDELNVYSQSKGRTPGVFVFNPFSEGLLARGPGFTPRKHQQQLAKDLENVPQFLCRQDDIVLVTQRPAVSFLSGLKQAGFSLPEFVETNGGGIDPAGGLARRKLGHLRPWAWGSDSMKLLEPLFPAVTGEERTSRQRFNPGLAQFYSKAWSAGFLRKVLRRFGDRRWLCPEREVGVAVATPEAAREAIEVIRARGHHRVVAKEAFGLAGQGMIRLWEAALLDTQKRWMEEALRRGPLVIEPWLEREADFSIQLEMEAGGLKLWGYTGLINDKRGQFLANEAEANAARRLPSRVIELFRTCADFAASFQGFFEELISMLEEELERAGHRGPVGIDAFVYRTAEGDCRLKPVVEINPRYTMGRLTLELMKRVGPGRHGLFRILSRVMARAEGFDSFAEYARALGGRHPLRLEGTPIAKISEGTLCLNDPAAAQGYLAVFEVAAGLRRSDFKFEI